MFSSSTSTALLLASLSTLALAQSSTNPVTGLLGNATITNTNPSGAAYIATLPNLGDTAIRGSVVAESVPSGEGVNVQVSLSGFPSDGGPFLYHIHKHAVSSDGDCSTTESHLDPFERGESPICDASLPMTCQVGDLSGKHGSINQISWSANYVDDYISTNPQTTGQFVGDRSLVVHFANKTIITCANFTLLREASSSSTASGSGTSSRASSTAGSTASSLSATASGTSTVSGSGASSTSALSSTGGATVLVVDIAAVAIGLLAFLI